MKIKNLVPALILSTVVVPATSMADMSANVGWVSEYIFRGIYQDDSSSAYAGIDYTAGAVLPRHLGCRRRPRSRDGSSTSVLRAARDFTYKVGYTGYFYTDDFDDTYQEINLGIGYGMFALDVAIGEWDGLRQPGSTTRSPRSRSLPRRARTTSSAAGAATSKIGDYFRIPRRPRRQRATTSSSVTICSIEDHGVDLSVDLHRTAPTSSSAIWDDGESLGDCALTFGIKKNYRHRRASESLMNTTTRY